MFLTARGKCGGNVMLAYVDIAKNMKQTLLSALLLLHTCQTLGHCIIFVNWVHIQIAYVWGLAV